MGGVNLSLLFIGVLLIFACKGQASSPSSPELESEKFAIEDSSLHDELLSYFKEYDGTDIESDIPGEWAFKLVDSSYRKDPSSEKLTQKDIEMLQHFSLPAYGHESFEPITVSSLKGLDYAISLKALHISSADTDKPYSAGGITDLTPLKKLKNLELLRLSHNNISDLTPLQNMHSIKKLYISHNRIKDLTPISGLTGLTDLDFAKNLVSTLEPIKELKNLKLLNTMINEISDLSPIENMTNLETLQVGSNKIYDISVLSNKFELTELWLESNYISDFSVLKNLTNLTYLDINDQEHSYEFDVSDKSKSESIPLKGIKYVIKDGESVSVNIEETDSGMTAKYNQDEEKIDLNFENMKDSQSINLKINFITKFSFYGTDQEANFDWKIKVTLQ